VSDNDNDNGALLRAFLTAIVAERDALKQERDEIVERLRAELAAAIKQRDGLLRALEEIANQDYRGNGSNESLIAQRALAAMRKGESDGK
jgi:hypothetical protein